MLIALTSKYDVGIVGTMDILHKQYPTERFIRCDQLLNDENGNLFKEPDGTFPVRLTFIGHSGWNREYGSLTTEELAESVAVYLTKMAEVNPESIKNLTHIDLIGCHVGLVIDADDEDAFAYTFARKINSLQAYGFNKITVNAFTNLSLSDPYPTYTLRFYHYPRVDSFDVLAFKDKDSHKKFEQSLSELELAMRTEEDKLQVEADALSKRKNAMQNEYQQCCYQLEQLINKRQAFKEMELFEENVITKKTKFRMPYQR